MAGMSPMLTSLPTTLSRPATLTWGPPTSGFACVTFIPARMNKMNNRGEKMAKITLIFHADDCCGCHACEVACKQEHGLGVGPRLIRILEKGSYFQPIYCHHCSHPPCKEACPSDPIYQDRTGAVLIKEEACIGCRACFDACPSGAMQFDEEREVAIKCDLCIIELCLLKGTITSLNSSEGNFDRNIPCSFKNTSFNNRVKEGRKPACVEVCPTHCILWGNIADITASMDNIIELR